MSNFNPKSLPREVKYRAIPSSALVRAFSLSENRWAVGRMSISSDKVELLEWYNDILDGRILKLHVIDPYSSRSYTEYKDDSGKMLFEGDFVVLNTAYGSLEGQVAKIKQGVRDKWAVNLGANYLLLEDIKESKNKLKIFSKVG